MNYLWSISTDNGSTWTDVEPSNGSKLKIDGSRDLAAGQVFFRKKIGGAIQFNGDTYRLLNGRRKNPTLRCAEILIRCLASCGLNDEEWRGKFSPGICRWDFDECTVEVKPETVDRYTCLLEQKDVKRNILAAEQVHGGANIVIDVEFGYSYSWESDIPGTMVHASQSGMVDGSNQPVNGWGLGLGGATVGSWTQSWAQTGTTGTPISSLDTDGELTGLGLNATLITIVNAYANAYFVANPATTTVTFDHITLYRFIWWRQQFTVNCEFGVSVPPPGSGWVLLTDNCGVDNTAIYAREPQIPYTFGDLYHGTAGPTPPVSPACTSWVQVSDFWFTADSMYICYPYTDANFTVMDRGRKLESVMNLLIDATGCGLNGVRSDFFEWDAPGTAIGYAPGINYYTGLANQVNALTIFQKTDAILPGASQGATIGELTIAEAMTMLMVMFRCLYDIDEDGYVRVEHYSFWEQSVGLDLSLLNDVNEPLAFESIGAEIPRIERAKFMDAQGRDFIGKDIVYIGPCVPNSDASSVKEWTPGRFSTDIEFVISDPDAISKDGFLLMACTVVSGSYIAIVDTGALSGQQHTNAPLSWANLERDFWTWDRYLPQANMNGVDTTFRNYLPNMKQDPVTIKSCCALVQYDPKKRVIGRLSDELETSAIVETSSLDMYNDRLTLVLRYAY